jgi:hypothetical protein
VVCAEAERWTGLLCSRGLDWLALKPRNDVECCDAEKWVGMLWTDAEKWDVAECIGGEE